MNRRPTIELSRLREIARTRWDPIAVIGLPADEYDRYMLAAVGKLRNGAAPADVVAYLVGIEIDWICGSAVASTQVRAEATVAALQTYLATLPAGPLKVRS
jgi:hypothetical protein